MVRAQLLLKLLKRRLWGFLQALIAVIGRSVNSMLPMMVEMYKQVGEYDWSRLFGCASLMSVRANGLAAETLGVDPEFVNVPIIGGASPDTCVPIFTQTQPCASFSPVSRAVSLPTTISHAHALHQIDNVHPVVRRLTFLSRPDIICFYTNNVMYTFHIPYTERNLLSKFCRKTSELRLQFYTMVIFTVEFLLSFIFRKIF